MQTLRLMVLGFPGAGKTFLLQHLVKRAKIVGTVVDPLEEFDVPERFLHLRGRGISIPSILEAALGQSAPNLLVIDEAHRFIKKWDTEESNALLDKLDIARNIGLSFVVATKHATKLPPDITTLAGEILIHPPRTPAVKRWLSEASLDLDINEILPDYHWFYLPVGAESRIVTTEEALDLVSFSLDKAVSSV